MKWLLSDGTVIHLGGKVEGSTIFARELRLCLNEGPLVPTGPIPSGGIPLDPNNPSHVDFFVRQEVERPCNKWMMIAVLDAPEVEPLPMDEVDEVDGLGEDVVY